jgi:hypothetical protein
VAASRPGKRAYLATERSFCAAQVGWIAFFAAEGMAIAVLGATWVLGCILALRAAPAVVAHWQARAGSAKGSA